MHPEQDLAELDRQWVEQSDQIERSLAHYEKFVMWLWVAMMVGLGLVFLGLWMNDLGEDVRLERLLLPWMMLSILIGIVLILGSLVLMIRNGRRIRAIQMTRMEYEVRRDELIRAIHDESD